MDIAVDGSMIAILGVGVALAGLILKLHHDTNSRIDRIETRIDRLETRVQSVESGLSRVEGFIVGIPADSGQRPIGAGLTRPFR